MKKILPALVITAVLIGVILMSVRNLPSRDEQVSPSTPPSQNASADDSGELNFPGDLQGFQLIQFVEGEAALADMVQLHGGVPIEAENGYIATYGNNSESFVLWITVSKNEEEAEYLLDIMDEKIPDSPVFTNRQEFETPNNTYYYVSGAGMENFYWYDENRVYWAGIQSENIMETLQLIINNF